MRKRKLLSSYPFGIPQELVTSETGRECPSESCDPHVRELGVEVW